MADLGNALHTTSVGGPFDTSLDLEIGMLADDGFFSLGALPIDRVRLDPSPGQLRAWARAGAALDLAPWA